MCAATRWGWSTDVTGGGGRGGSLALSCLPLQHQTQSCSLPTCRKQAHRLPRLLLPLLLQILSLQKCTQMSRLSSTQFCQKELSSSTGSKLITSTPFPCSCSGGKNVERGDRFWSYVAMCRLWSSDKVQDFPVWALRVKTYRVLWVPLPVLSEILPNKKCPQVPC